MAAGELDARGIRDHEPLAATVTAAVSATEPAAEVATTWEPSASREPGEPALAMTPAFTVTPAARPAEDRGKW